MRAELNKAEVNYSATETVLSRDKGSWKMAVLLEGKALHCSDWPCCSSKGLDVLHMFGREDYMWFLMHFHSFHPPQTVWPRFKGRWNVFLSQMSFGRSKKIFKSFADGGKTLDGNFILLEDKLYRIIQTNKHVQYRICIPQTLMDSLFQVYHNSLLSGHLGVFKTYKRLHDDAWTRDVVWH